ncbi:YecA family protein [Edaphobacter modestus]|nr:SEC-C metal-binding domain-containing protein [Edaphobacter modestus]
MRKIGRNEICTCDSGKKYKLCCRGAHTILDLFTANLLSKIKRLQNEIVQAQNESNEKISESTKKYIDIEPDRSVDERCASIEKYAQWLELQIRDSLSRHSPIFWMCLDRRFPPGILHPADATRHYAMSNLTNLTKTSLFHKYGSTTLEVFSTQTDGSFDFEVSDRDIVEIFGSLVPFFWELTFLPNEYRRVAKGGVVTAGSKIGFTALLDPDMERLVKLYDRRRQGSHLAYTSMGGLGGFGYSYLAFPMSIKDDPLVTIGSMPTNGETPHNILNMGRVDAPSFRLVEIFLKGLDLLTPFEKRFIEIAGITFAELRVCLLAQKKYILDQWSPHAEYTLVCRGVRFAEESTIKRHLNRCYTEVAATHGISSDGCEQVVDKYLKLLEGNPREYDVFLRRNFCSFTKGRICSLDLSIAHLSFIEALVDIELDDDMKNIKGVQFEKYVAQCIAQEVKGISFPIKPGLKLKIKGENNPFAEVDIYAQVDNALFLIECKAYSITRDYLKGSPKAVWNRWQLMIDWLAKSDSRARKIANAKEGSNFKIPSDVRYIIPVVCSAFSEFFWSEDDPLYLKTGSVPRVCNLGELCSVLNDSLSDLKQKSFAIEI